MQSPRTWDENAILRTLAGNGQALRPHLKPIALQQNAILHEAGAEMRQVYFPVSGMVSLLTVTRSGAAIETGIIGKEGVVCGWPEGDGWQAFGRAIVQIPGGALQVASGEFLRALDASARLRERVHEYQSFMLLQAQQSAACHALHSVEERLCRWLLQSQDAVGSEIVPLTQEFLSQMLGVQRTSVSLAALKLQELDLIKYTRGRLQVLDRAGLEKCACECYDVVRTHLERTAAQAQTRRG